MGAVGVPHLAPPSCCGADDKENVEPPSLTHVGPEVASKTQLAVGNGPAIEQEAQVLLDIAQTKQDDRGGIIQVCRCVQYLWLLQHSGRTQGCSNRRVCCGGCSTCDTLRSVQHTGLACRGGFAQSTQYGRQ